MNHRDEIKKLYIIRDTIYTAVEELDAAIYSHYHKFTEQELIDNWWIKGNFNGPHNVYEWNKNGKTILLKGEIVQALWVTPYKDFIDWDDLNEFSK